jgi:hypothetical protein
LTLHILMVLLRGLSLESEFTSRYMLCLPDLRDPRFVIALLALANTSSTGTRGTHHAWLIDFLVG